MVQVTMSKQLGMGDPCRPLVWVHFPDFFLPCIKLKLGKSILSSSLSRPQYLTGPNIRERDTAFRNFHKLQLFFEMQTMSLKGNAE